MNGFWIDVQLVGFKVMLGIGTLVLIGMWINKAIENSFQERLAQQRLVASTQSVTIDTSTFIPCPLTDQQQSFMMGYISSMTSQPAHIKPTHITASIQSSLARCTYFTLEKDHLFTIQFPLSREKECIATHTDTWWNIHIWFTCS